MNWLDGIIGFISPEWGARREAWRQSLTEMRNYDAGNYDRGNANWRVLNQSAEFTDRYSRDNVRARARDLVFLHLWNHLLQYARCMSL